MPLTEQILEKIRESAREGRISCHRARRLAEELNVSYREIGQAVNELKLKIMECELGCF